MVGTMQIMFDNASTIGGYLKYPDSCPDTFTVQTGSTTKTNAELLTDMLQAFINEEENVNLLSSEDWNNMYTDIVNYCDGTLTDERTKLVSELDAEAALNIVSGAFDVAALCFEAIPIVGFALSAIAIASMGATFALEHDISNLENTIVSDISNAERNISTDNAHFTNYNSYADARETNVANINKLDLAGNVIDVHDLVLGITISTKKLNDGTVTTSTLSTAFQNIYAAASDDSISGYVSDIISMQSTLYDISASDSDMPSASDIESALASTMVDLPASIYDAMSMAQQTGATFLFFKFLPITRAVSRILQATRSMLGKWFSARAETTSADYIELTTLDENGYKAATQSELDAGTAELSTADNAVEDALRIEVEDAVTASKESKLLKFKSGLGKGLIVVGALCSEIIGILQIVEASKLNESLKSEISTTKSSLLNFFRNAVDVDNDNFPTIPSSSDASLASQQRSLVADDWAKGVLAQLDFTMSVGSYDATLGCAESAVSDGYSTVYCSGYTDNVVNTVIIGVAGDGAPYVSLSGVPDTTGTDTSGQSDAYFLGWDGSQWSDDATATPVYDATTGTEVYWYKGLLDWYNMTDQKDADDNDKRNGYFKAYTYCECENMTARTYCRGATMLCVRVPPTMHKFNLSHHLCTPHMGHVLDKSRT